MPQPINIFFAYARADQPLRDELDKHLAFLRRSKLIKGWYDGNISAGEEWEEAIEQHLRQADLILLLVSPDFIASDYCYDVEMRKALSRHEAGEAVVVPVILRPCRWQRTPFAKFQALPKDAKAVTLWPNRDQAFASAAEAIDRVVRQLHAERNAPPPDASPSPNVEPAAQSTPITAPALESMSFIQTDENRAKLLIARLSFELDLIHIPAGEFLMGSDPAKDKDARDNEQPQHRLHLEDYTIGKYPVTNAQYGAFVKATGYDAHKKWKGGSYPEGGDTHPAIYVSWNDAVAFCRWLSDETGQTVRLPTEAEWEKAARGTAGLIYPWGNEVPTEKLCNFKLNVGQTTPVGKYSSQGDSPYGCVDMAGNVWEWCSTLWEEKAYPFQVRDEWTEAYLGQEGKRVLRGGGWGSSGNVVRAAIRYRSNPTVSLSINGFRCARSP